MYRVQSHDISGVHRRPIPFTMTGIAEIPLYLICLIRIVNKWVHAVYGFECLTEEVEPSWTRRDFHHGVLSQPSVVRPEASLPWRHRPRVTRLVHSLPRSLRSLRRSSTEIEQALPRQTTPEPTRLTAGSRFVRLRRQKPCSNRCHRTKL